MSFMEEKLINTFLCDLTINNIMVTLITADIVAFFY